MNSRFLKIPSAICCKKYKEKQVNCLNCILATGLPFLVLENVSGACSSVYIVYKEVCLIMVSFLLVLTACRRST